MNPDPETPDPEEPVRRLPAPFHPDAGDEHPKPKRMSIPDPDPDYEDDDN